MYDLAWPIDDPSAIEGISDHQREQAMKALTGPIGVLLGSPGTGKTYTVAAIVRHLCKRFQGHDFRISAPTGKAAVRLTENLARNGVDIQATTIHRMLGVGRNGHDGKGWGFQFNEDCPMPCQFVISDEWSMVETDLASHFFRALPPGVRVLLIGDLGQLPPIGHGAPLRDLLAAGIPFGELTEIKRNAGRIVTACQEIRRGVQWRASPTIDLPAGENLAVRHAATPAAQVATIRELLRTSAANGIDPKWDVQILTAVNDKSAVSRRELNRLLQDLLTPRPLVMGGEAAVDARQPVSYFRVGDKVISTKNQLLELIESTENTGIQDESDNPPDGIERRPSEFVANGEIGRVSALEPKRMLVEFFSPKRSVVVPLMPRRASSEDSARTNGRAAGSNHAASPASPASPGCDFDLAYAITVHKSQGSSAKVIIYVADESGGARMIGSRELVYTAISRAEEICLIVGQRRVVDIDCRRVSLVGRKTFLAELIRGDEAALPPSEILPSTDSLATNEPEFPEFDSQGI